MKAFDRIIGYETVKNELYQIIDMFKNSEMYKEMGAKLPKGVLLYGPPGMGKTMLAQALIEECNEKTFVIRKNKDESNTIKEIKEVFEQAAQEKSAIILIDDLDKFSDSNDVDVDAIAFVAVQAGIDSVKDKNVLVIATINNYAKLPRSLKRNGRFDRKIGLKSPTNEDAYNIIKYYLSTKRVAKDINYEDISKMISYTSCADLETIINESAIYATYARKENIEIEDIVKAYLRDQYDIPDENTKCSDEEAGVTALHEAGHAVIAEAIKKGSVGFMSIQTSGRSSAGGFTHLCEEFTRRPEHILISLGGKAAVELYHQGRCASGCQSDLGKAIDMLRAGITTSGSMGIAQLDASTQEFPKTSEDYKSRNEAVVHAELERYLFMARDILIKNKDFLFKIAESLKEKKNLLYSDVQAIRESVKVEEVSQSAIT